MLVKVWFLTEATGGVRTSNTGYIFNWGLNNKPLDSNYTYHIKGYENPCFILFDSPASVSHYKTIVNPVKESHYQDIPGIISMTKSFIDFIHYDDTPPNGRRRGLKEIFDESNEAAKLATTNFPIDLSTISTGTIATNYTPEVITNFPIDLPTTNTGTTTNYTPKVKAGDVDIFVSSATINKSNKEKKDMFNFKDKFQFGPMSSKDWKMSLYGVAFASNCSTSDGSYVQEWVAYDKNTGDLTDVTGMIFECPNMIFSMPVALSAVKVGDILLHGGSPVYVTAINEKAIDAVIPARREKITIIPTKSPFGFDFVTKVMPLMENFGNSSMVADADNPFGNLWPLMLLSGDKNNNNDMLTMMMLMNMNGKNAGTFDPMMFMFMMNNKE